MLNSKASRWHTGDAMPDIGIKELHEFGESIENAITALKALKLRVGRFELGNPNLKGQLDKALDEADKNLKAARDAVTDAAIDAIAKNLDRNVRPKRSAAAR